MSKEEVIPRADYKSSQTWIPALIEVELTWCGQCGGGWTDSGRRICRRQMIHSSVTFAQQTFLLSIYIRLQAAVVVKARRRRGKQMSERNTNLSGSWLLHCRKRTLHLGRKRKQTVEKNSLKGKKEEEEETPSECIGELCADPGAGQACTHKKKSFSLSPYSSKLYGPVHFQQQEE